MQTENLPYRLVPVAPLTFIVGTAPMANHVEYAKTYADALRLRELVQAAEIAKRQAEDYKHGFNFRSESVPTVKIFQEVWKGFNEVLPVAK